MRVKRSAHGVKKACFYRNLGLMTVDLIQRRLTTMAIADRVTQLSNREVNSRRSQGQRCCVYQANVDVYDELHSYIFRAMAVRPQPQKIPGRFRDRLQVWPQ